MTAWLGIVDTAQRYCRTLAIDADPPLTAGKVQAADIVITMGCGDACPVYPGQRYLDWDLPDPARPGQLLLAL